MRGMFQAYYPPSKDEQEKLWTEGLIVLDTNVLLNLFRYSEVAGKELLSLLEAYKTQLWLPHQVGLEYQRKWWSTLHDQTADMHKIETQLSNAAKAVENLHRHPAGESTDITAKIVKRLRKSQRQLGSHREKASRKKRHQDLHDSITELFEGRVGEPYVATRMQEIQVAGDKRYAEKVPPGFEDAKKGEGRSYGDLVLWLQILDKAKTDSKPVIFVTDDDKEDWWLSEHGQKRGPQPALVEEFYEASGERVHFYNSHSFLAYAKKEREADISQETVQEAKNVSTVRHFKALTRTNSNNLRRALQWVGPNFLDSPEFRDMSEKGRVAAERTLNEVGHLAVPPDRLEALAQQMIELGITPPTIAQSQAAQEYWERAARRATLDRYLARDQDEAEREFNRLNLSDSLPSDEDDSAPEDDGDEENSN